jgi:signal transduction histidine kinase
VAEFADVIVSAQRRLAGLVEEIKDFARGAAAQYLREPGDLATAVEEALGILRFDAEVKTLKLTLEVKERPIVRLHRGKIAQVVVNLVRNAAQASPANGAVEVRVEMSDGEARVVVSDHGVGMPEEIIRRLGEPFFTTKERGSGLGLGISRRVVDEHGGSIEFASVPGQGTSVTVRLPVIA